MFCTNCGRKLADGTNFCGHCGCAVISVEETKTGEDGIAVEEQKNTSSEIEENEVFKERKKFPWWIFCVLPILFLIIMMLIEFVPAKTKDIKVEGKDNELIEGGWIGSTVNVKTRITYYFEFKADGTGYKTNVLYDEEKEEYYYNGGGYSTIFEYYYDEDKGLSMKLSESGDYEDAYVFDLLKEEGWDIYLADANTLIMETEDSLYVYHRQEESYLSDVD